MNGTKNMAKRDKYENPLVSRYASKEMSYIWSPEKKFTTWRSLWVYLAEGEKELGLDITEEQIAELKKFQNNVHLIKGDSNQVLKKMEMSKIEFVFINGGHEYDTVKNDLNYCIEVINNSGTVLCDDYNLSYAPGVKKAIDEFVKNNGFKCEIILNNRFAKIEKN